MFRRLSDYGLIAFAVFSSLVALSLIYFNQSQFEENVSAIFDHQKGKYDTTLAVRSNEYLLSAMQSIPALLHQQGPLLDDTREKLDLAYAFLNFGEYRQNYTCVNPSLDKITQIRDIVERDLFALQTQADLWSDVLQCQMQVITRQTNMKSDLATQVITQSTENKRWFTVGIVLAYLIGILLWLIHERQRDRLINTLREKLRWQRRAETDHLTGTYNRLALEDALTSKLNNTSSHKPSLVFMYDIDLFKDYNDHYGHVKGDETLKRVTQAVEQILRAEDRQFRYGGEEFIVLCENLVEESIEPIAERALSSVRALKIPHEKSPFGIVTISLGCQVLDSSSHSCKTFLEKVDKKLYSAKRSGRNCFIC